MKKSQKVWWKEAIAYQIYPKSFYDSNGDGVGDILGIIHKLDYLQELGIDLLWISPVYQSPMNDNGYDISNYYKIDPLFGTNEQMEELLQEAEKRGVRIIMDLVANHCSNEHPWFQKAVREPDSEEAGYFIFKRTEHDVLPNNWRSNFGGSVWTKLPDGRFYMHTFDQTQPDLNWENPKLRAQMYRMMNWWLDKGVAGFRVDAITFIKKDTSFLSRPPEIGQMYPIERFQNYPGIGDFLQEMKREVYDRHDCVTVAEAPGVPYGELQDYMGEQGHFSMIFDFNWDHMELEYGRKKSDTDMIRGWREKIFASQWLTQKTGWAPVFLENHDQPRCPNKFFEPEQINRQSITMLAAMYFFLRGTPFIYQGQELGVTNYPIYSIEDVYDTAAHGRYRDALERGEQEDHILAEFNQNSRDHARTPFQWDDTEYAGFSEVIPWIPVHPDYREVNVAAQKQNEDSILNFYKKLIFLRKNARFFDTLVYGDFEPCCKEYETLIAYSRIGTSGRIVVLNNFSSQPLELTLPYPCSQVLLSNDKINMADNKKSMVLNQFQSVIYHTYQFR